MNFLQRIKLKSLKKKVKNLYEKREKGANVDVKYEAKAQMDLGNFYSQHLFDKDLPNAEVYALECYRAAAILGNSEAQYIFANRQMEKGKFWDELSSGMYGRDIHQKYAKACYEEAHNYAQKAEDNGYALAKRLRGLAYINAWGVEKDKTKGFQLVVDSIEEEGSWDKATQIFEEIGLNTPEFFSSIMALRGRKHNTQHYS